MFESTETQEMNAPLRATIDFKIEELVHDGELPSNFEPVLCCGCSGCGCGMKHQILTAELLSPAL